MHEFDFVVVGHVDVGHREFGCVEDRPVCPPKNWCGAEIFFSLRSTYGIAFDAWFVVYGRREVRNMFFFLGGEGETFFGEE